MPKPLGEIKLIDLMDDNEQCLLEIWGDDPERQMAALEDWMLSYQELGGIPIGEVHRWHNDRPTAIESWLLVQDGEGNVVLPFEEVLDA